jgi:hypothetical protein
MNLSKQSEDKENTMNLSKLSEDKELFSGERSSKENIDKLFSIERYLFNKLIIKEVLSYIE